MKRLPIFISLVIFCYTNLLYASIKTEKWLTSNGAQVIFYPAKEVPMLDVCIAFAAGSAYDQEKFGLSTLTTNLINQGAKGQSATALADVLADHGAQLAINNSKDIAMLCLRTLVDKKALDGSIGVLAQMVQQPDFPEAAFEREKKQLLMSIQQTEESPDDVALERFFHVLYQGHPYAHPVNGTLASVDKITRQEVIDFYKKYYVAQNAMVVMVGAIDRSQAQQLASQLTRLLPAGQKAAAVTKANPLKAPERININFPSSQTVVRLGQMGIDHHHPDYFPLLVGNYILGGGSLVSRLSIEVREKRGLTYGVDSQFLPMPGEGPFMISLSTKNEEAKNALQVTQATLNEFIQKGPNANELAAAKQYLTGSFPLSFASNRDIAGLLLRLHLYHLPEDYLDNYVKNINAVSLDDVKRAFKQQIHPNQLLLVTVGQL